MAFAVISDIHSNIEALETILCDIHSKGIKDIYCLGDIVGYGANPAECCNLIKKNCRAGAVFGNHDAAIAENYRQMIQESPWKRILNRIYSSKYFSEQDYEIAKIEDKDMSIAMAYTENKLYPKNKSFLAGLPMTLKKDDMLFTHQNPAAGAFNPQNSYTLLYRRSLSYLFNVFEYFDEDPIMETQDNANIIFLNKPHEELAVFALDYLCKENIRTCFMGHTHVASCFFKKEKDRNCKAILVKYNTPDDTECKTSFEIDLKPDYNYIINPGSVGQPRDTDTRASYLIADDNKITWHRIPYPNFIAHQKIKDANLPITYADRLLTGT